MEVEFLGFIISVPSENAVRIAQTYGVWLEAGAIVVSAIIALVTIIVVRRMTRKRATLDLMHRLENEELHQNRRLEFQKLRDNKDKQLSQWASGEHDNSKEQLQIKRICNQYEMIAVGIFEGILDEKLYRRWFRSQLLLDWAACKGFIVEFRQRKKIYSIYAEFEALAEEWSTPPESPLEALVYRLSRRQR